MRRLSLPLRALALSSLAALCLLLPGLSANAVAQNSSDPTVQPTLWLEEGYKWTYTYYLWPHPSFDELPDVTVIYELGALETIDDKEYYPVIMSDIEYCDGSETTYSDIVGFLRQDVDGTIFYKPRENVSYHSQYWLKGTTTMLDDAIRKGLRNGTLTANEYPIWRGSDVEYNWIFEEESIRESAPVEVPTLSGTWHGERFLEPNGETWSVWEPKIFLAYVDGLGRVGVYEDGTLAPEFEGNFFGPNIEFFSGFVEIDFYRSLLYSIQRSDGTYLVLNEQNAPKYDTESVESVGADAAGVAVSTGHNTLTVASAKAVEVAVSDLAGRVIATATVEGEHRFNLGAGIYLLSIDGHTRKVAVK